MQPIQKLEQSDENKSEVNKSSAPPERDMDFLCVRYIGDINEEIARIAFENKRVDYTTVSWVGHCVTTAVVEDIKGGTRTVHLRLHDCSSTFPDELFSRGGELPCTVEWMPKGIPDM